MKGQQSINVTINGNIVSLEPTEAMRLCAELYHQLSALEKEMIPLMPAKSKMPSESLNTAVWYCENPEAASVKDLDPARLAEAGLVMLHGEGGFGVRVVKAPGNRLGYWPNSHWTEILERYVKTKLLPQAQASI